MSLDIDIARVTEVLLPDGKWHQVADASFDLDAYEYGEGGDENEDALFKGGQEKGLVPATGACWSEHDDSKGNRRTVFCPITAILAVSYGWEPARNHGDTTKTVSPGEIIKRMNQTQDERTDDE